jgi:hypothetical protein
MDSLDESSRKEIFHILAKNNNDLEKEFSDLKESAVNKLKVLSVVPIACHSIVIAAVGSSKSEVIVKLKNMLNISNLLIIKLLSKTQ